MSSVRTASAHEAVRRHVIQALGRFWRHEVGRRPFIMPIVLEA